MTDNENYYEELAEEIESEMQPILDELREALENKPKYNGFILNPKRVKEIEWCYAILKKIIPITDPEMQINVKQSNTIDDRFVIEVICDNVLLNIRSKPEYQKVLQLCDVAGMNALLNEKILLEFDFDNCLMPFVAEQ